MGPDPILTEVPVAVPAGAIICLIALAVTAWPILAGERTTARRVQQAKRGSWACLAAVVLALLTGLAPGLYGFITLTAIAAVAATTLLRTRQQVPR
jgi:cobalamin synthase